MSELQDELHELTERVGGKTKMLAGNHAPRSLLDQQQVREHIEATAIHHEYMVLLGEKLLRALRELQETADYLADKIRQLGCWSANVRPADSGHCAGMGRQRRRARCPEPAPASPRVR